jgi:glycerol uptake operon antiterminator
MGVDVADSREALLKSGPVIASVKNEVDLAAALASPCRTLFILYGDITNIEGIVSRARRGGRSVLVNMDMIDGYAVHGTAIEHLKRRTGVDGILSSKATLVRAARERGLLAVHRLFMIDSFAYHQFPEQIRASQPDCIEVMPGCVPRVIEWITHDTSVPLIAGGLVCDVRDAVAALRAGAAAVTTSHQLLWSEGAQQSILDALAATTRPSVPSLHP